MNAVPASFNAVSEYAALGFSLHKIPLNRLAVTGLAKTTATDNDSATGMVVMHKLCGSVNAFETQPEPAGDGGNRLNNPELMKTAVGQHASNRG